MAKIKPKAYKKLYFSNRKEYYRRRRISEGVTRNWIIRKQQTPKAKREKIILSQREKQKERIRKQAVIYTKYFISIRAVTLNLNILELQLRQALDEFINSNEDFQNLFANKETTIGYEEEEIDEKEERDLNKTSIYIQTEIRGSTQTIKWS